MSVTRSSSAAASSAARPKKAAKASKAPKRVPLSCPRVFSSEGVSPFDSVEWSHRDVVQTDWRTGAEVFAQYGVEFPVDWSENAATIVTTKYFRGALGTPEREVSLRQVIDRVVGVYVQAAREFGYFASDADVDVFGDELRWLLLHQVFSFNSPVWFNVGTSAPQTVSACFILHVEDSLKSILNWYTEEGVIFQAGSGAGVNLSAIRSSKELLRSSGGKASGPVSFMRGADASAGTIKSGGACLAPWAEVFTATGPRRVDELARSGDDFVTLSYNPVLGRVQACTARAFSSGVKRLVRLTTDKGVFSLSADHPVLLSSGGYVPAGELTAGMSLRPATVTVNSLGYMRVGLHDGGKGKESLHRLAAADVCGVDTDGREVHHRDRNPANNDPANNDPANLEVLTRSDHLRVHAHEALENGTHPFQRYHGKGNHPQISGQANGMSSSGNRTEQARRNQVAGMQAAGVYQRGQDAAATARMINTAYRIVNSGGSIDSFDEYFTGRVRLAGKMGYSRDEQLRKIESRFGSYEQFRDTVRAGNHRVVSVEQMELSDVYDVEVDSDTPADHSASDGHNFMMVSEDRQGREASWTGIFAHNTRRAAKMVVLDVDHPDIAEFIETKAHEEGKIRALRDAGYDMEFGGHDSTSVQYQNANNSVRVSDEFMEAVADGGTFALRARLDGSVVETVDARGLFAKMCQAAWECADPGIQYDDTINRWHTLKNTGPITASNPCSEYLSVDNSSCNLASLNLMKFRLPDGGFDVDRFVAAVELVTTAMDVSICFADFPTEAIGVNTRRFRQLGIGYANLGALLMASGLPYDSDEGRAYAAAITALMTGVAYRRSAQMAGAVGAYDGFAENRQPHTEVMRMHTDAAEKLATRGVGGLGQVASAARAQWAECLTTGEKFGWRNSQASVLAPTGTIGFMMDCDTTGIEPDFSLVKYKKLVGGSSMQIVNQALPAALTTLGYSPAQVAEIEAHILEHGNVVDAPGLDPAHYAVFDTATGVRPISPMGHVLMMAAVQPFLSGAISKTVNMPESATVADVERVYLEGWRLGLKALAIYRDNCKVGQPLSDAKAKTVESEPAADVVEVASTPARRRLPATRTARTYKFSIAGVSGYLTTGEYEDGTLGELFVRVSKQGSTLSGIVDGLAMAVSVGLQSGVPLETFVAKYVNSSFEPAGLTIDPDVRMAKSLLDWMFRRLAIDYLPVETRQAFGIYTMAERMAAVDAPAGEPPAAVEPAVDVPATVSVTVSSPAVEVEKPICMTCGVSTFMQRSGSCWACRGCGGTTGCS